MADYRLPDGSTPVLLSSDGAETLRAEAAAVRDYLLAHPGATPDAVAEMLFRTRTPRRHRALAMVTGRDELLAALEAVAAGRPHPSVVAGGKPAIARRVGYTFPGQGSQRAGMGRMYYERSPVFKAAVDEAEEVFDRLFDVSPLTYLLDEAQDGEERLRVVQPALMMQMLGLAAMWRAAGVEPAATVGHSQGEIAAGVVSDSFTLADAVRVVTLRGTLVDGLGMRFRAERRSFSMAVLGVDRDACEALLARTSGFAELSVINSAHVLVIGGDQPVLAEIVAELTAKGIFAKEIRVAYPAHTSLVSEFRATFCDPALVAEFDRPSFTEGPIECIGATLGAALTADLPVGDYWYWNLRNTVRFDQAVGLAVERGIDTFVEISEHPTLALAMMENLGTAAAQRDFQVLGTSRRTADDLREFTRSVAQVAVSDTGYRWDALRVDGPKRLPLLDFPHTVTGGKHLWAVRDYSAAPVEPEPVPAPVHRLVERWKPLGKRRLVPPRTIAVLDYSGHCADLVTAIGSAAPRHGATVVDRTAGHDTLVVLVPPAGASVAAVEPLAEFAALPALLTDLGGVTDVWLVTAGGEAVLDGETPDPFHAAAQAAYRCLAAEHIGTALRHLDLPAASTPEEQAKALVGAVHAAGEPELAVRAGKVYAKRLGTADDLQPLDLTGRTEIVIVGGTGELGLDFAERFARAGAGRVTLVSRSGGSPRARARIEELRELGGTEIAVRPCDVTDEAAVRELGAGFDGRPVDLVVHAAVDYAAAGTAPTPAAVRAAALPKSTALAHLVRHLPRTADARIVLCSSLSATIGGRGHFVYAAVNRLLDAAAAGYRADGIAVTSVQWGLWRAVGADRADALAAITGTGLLPMDPAAAITAGITAEPGNALVAAADWARISDLFGLFGMAPLFADLEIDAPAPAGSAAPTSGVPGTTAAGPTGSAGAGNTPGATADSPAGTAETVRVALRTVMGMEPNDDIDGTTPLVALGLDSLQALDLRKRIETDLSRDLPVTAILGGASLDEVVALLG
ncbi:nocobactin polyketide synthase NbtC [Nocardia asteroides]|uniref:nocobactin polyketide synthase NbtC n=1 Tax=Nocardia asteroides TaxID=1824 RepID=UPI001E29C666|nr:nocobactin polyketide synthase NbtC [Nocardia asteroides]UGT59964.1 nocobactin polyketide synthase NbtC [Nocardia asteroides]